MVIAIFRVLITLLLTIHLTLNPKPEALSPKPQTLNPKPSTLNPKP